MRSGTVWLVVLGLMSFTTVTAAEFRFEDVVEQARERAGSAYQAPDTIPDFMRNLSYQDYQSIRFDPEKNLWKEASSKFQVMLVPAGKFYTRPVNIYVVDAEGVSKLEFDKSLFNMPDSELSKRVPADLGYAGFKLTFPFDGPDIANQFLVFAGASYFRGVSKDTAFGLSARGVAVDTGLPSGEQFPDFTDFWLVRPARNSEEMRVYALLDGPSLTGAYQFTVYPKEETRLDVKARLFIRDDIELLGLAPLTSMFFYGENTPRPDGEWRPQVHDSDGLLIHDGESGEWLWRPLINPKRLATSFHQTSRIAGFGLIQRDTEFRHFEDLEARYERRPSAWVSMDDDWGAGDVVLVEIPTDDETNDNIVAFWSPDDKVTGGAERSLEYSMTFGGPDVARHPGGKAVNTFIGAGDRIGGGDQSGAYRVLVDFAGGKLADIEPDAPVVSKVSGGDGVEVLEHFVEWVQPENKWRLSILARPAKDSILQLRGYLELDDQVVTETWTYSLPPGAGPGSQR
ncbi:glucan biosynthesis protein G [Marinobacter sp. LQ44]|uniref:glucan biosynthesis protein G n=1 Tax=unclassified Marinobacter TaxID=83889 RepID=UPI000718BF4A|nr:glucan biosynthesis protein G [Marinobacter sp. LQ44]AMQ87219.1 glucan biosynthesis protein G [Marinobacter sp. LQ44]